MECGFSMIKARIAEDPSDRRRDSRVPVTIDGTMRELGTTGIECKVLNISERGFMAETAGHFDIGARVWLMIPGRERANAVVRWIAGEKIGAEFAEPIALDQLGA